MTAPELLRSPVARVRTWSLRARVGRVVLAMLAFVAVLLSAVAISFVQFAHRGDDVIKRWEPAVSLSQDVLSDLVNQETGIRGYALSGIGSFLQPYMQYQKQEVEDEAHLRSLIKGHANLIADVDAFAAAAQQWRAEIAAPFIRRVEAHDRNVAKAVAGVQAKDSFDVIRQRDAQLTADLSAVRHTAGVQRRDAEVFVWVTLIVTAVLILGLFYLVWRGLRRSVLDPIERLANQTQYVADGNLDKQIVPYGPPEIAALGGDVDAMRTRILQELAVVERARLELVARTEELARSNGDLEQFAYVASHDLSEPLRKVANFCQLLERQYGDQLDEKAKQYIDFAVDGAKRMQVLINDLLSFSRVGRTTDQFAPVPLEEVLTRALGNLGPAISESDAQISHSELPVVHGDATLLTALMQNLVGNAIKYRTDAPPVVAIFANRIEEAWQVSVSDNGIGIEPQYAERIFAIFQRLHLREEYGGTGIGLALCRKIVEFHGGRIWLDRHEGPGATLTFTIPDFGDREGTDAVVTR